jgi:hypothetical protein
VACCLKCNNKKGDKTLNELGWSLNFSPRMPAGTIWMVRGAERFEPEWDPYLAVSRAA